MKEGQRPDAVKGSLKIDLLSSSEVEPVRVLAEFNPLQRDSDRTIPIYRVFSLKLTFSHAKGLGVCATPVPM